MVKQYLFDCAVGEPTCVPHQTKRLLEYYHNYNNILIGTEIVHYTLNTVHVQYCTIEISQSR